MSFFAMDLQLTALELNSQLCSDVSKEAICTTTSMTSCNGSSDSTQFIRQCDQNFNDSQMYISAGNTSACFHVFRSPPDVACERASSCICLS